LSETNGETVAGTTDDDNGEVSTDTWPDAAPPRDELSEDQIAVIEAVADPTNEWDSVQEVRRQTVPHRASNYAYRVLRHSYPEGYKRVRVDNRGSKKIDLSEQDVRDIRHRLLNGETTRQVAEDYNIWKQIVSEAARGERGPSVDEPPVLSYERGGREWYIDDSEDPQAALSDDTDTSDNESLRSLRGVGLKREQWLKQAGYQDVSDVRQASIDELTGVKGIGEKYAKAIKADLSDGFGDWFTATEHHTAGEPTTPDSDNSELPEPPTASDGLSISEEYDTTDADADSGTNRRRQTVVCAVLAFLAGWLLGGADA
jgi:hypothetical protein